MTPQEYGNRYLKMSYTYNRERYEAPIDAYLAMDASICSADKLKGNATAKGWLTDAIKQAEGKGSIKRTGDALTATAPDGEVQSIEMESVKRAFRGKGSPSDYSKTLWLATHVGQVTNRENQANSQRALARNYAKWYLGTDCSGFAMNYLGVQKLIKDLDVNSKAQRRQAFSDIKTGDAQVSFSPTKGYHHIALVTSVDISGKTAVVHTVESYGWRLIGVSSHKRTMQMTSGGVFVALEGGKPDPRNEYYYHPVPYRGAAKM